MFNQCRKHWPFLTFDPVAHEYRVNGARVRSVTQTLEAAGLYPPITPAARTAMERGRAVHLATQLLDEGRLDESSVDPRIVKFLDAYKRFKEDARPDILLIEQPVYHGALGYAGTIDRVVRIGGGLAPAAGVLDIKTGSVGHTTPAQLSGYEMAFENACSLSDWADVSEAIRGWKKTRWSLLLRADGTYSLTRHDNGRDLWMAALTIARFKEEILKEKTNGRNG